MSRGARIAPRHIAGPRSAPRHVSVPITAAHLAEPGSGLSVAERAVRRVRLIAVGLLLLSAAGYRPGPGATLDDRGALVLGCCAAALLGAMSLLVSRRVGTAGAPRWALVAAGCDAAVILPVIFLAGLPPASFAIVLLLLPLLEAALWAGLAGLAAMWVTCAVALGGYTAVTAGPRIGPDVQVLLVTLPTLVLTIIPLALLAEHLVSEVTRLDQAQLVANDRASLLARLSAITTGLFEQDLLAVAKRLVSGATDLGADSAAIVGSGATSATLASSGETPGKDQVLGGQPEGRLLDWHLPVPGREALHMQVVVSGEADDVGRRLDAIELLVAQGRVALANTAVAEQLHTLRSEQEAAGHHDRGERRKVPQ